MGPKKLSQARHEQLKLYPFTMEQSWELLNAARLNPAPDPKANRPDTAAKEPLESFSDDHMKQWAPCVALAGGHPSLLLDCYRPMYTTPDPGFQYTTSGAIVSNLQTHHRVLNLVDDVTSAMASEFVYDALTGAMVRESKHATILDAGLAWYLPTDEEEEEEGESYVTAMEGTTNQCQEITQNDDDKGSVDDQKEVKRGAVEEQTKGNTEPSEEPPKPSEGPSIAVSEKKEEAAQEANETSTKPSGKEGGDEAEGKEYAGRKGMVSAPYPYLLELMTRAGGMYGAVARNINAVDKNYRPTKAMEYVATLAVSLHLLNKVDHWVQNINVGTGEAIKKISSANQAFMCVWPSGIEPGTDFGGKEMKRDKNGKEVQEACIGQVKMQEPGADSTQGLAEVMDLAWFIGHSVRSGELQSRVKAFFVSSRKAPRHKKMQGLCHAFRVAMSGQETKDEAKKEAALRYGIKEAKVNITHIIEIFQTRQPSEQFQFTYIGRSIEAKGSNLVVEMKTLLPTGIFTGWH